MKHTYETVLWWNKSISKSKLQSDSVYLDSVDRRDLISSAVVTEVSCQVLDAACGPSCHGVPVFIDILYVDLIRHYINNTVARLVNQ